MLLKLVKTTKTNAEGKRFSRFYLQLENGYLMPIDIRRIVKKDTQEVLNPKDFAVALAIAEDLPQKEGK